MASHRDLVLPGHEPDASWLNENSHKRLRDINMDNLAQWYNQFYAMKAALSDETPDDIQWACTFYESIVGDPAIVRLTQRLRLQITDGGQDWPIEVADADRVAEFLDIYEQGALDADEQYHLMELIVASLEAHMQECKPAPELFARFRKHFMNSFEAHGDTAAYWAGIGNKSGGHFTLTPFMRHLWEAYWGEQNCNS